MDDLSFDQAMQLIADRDSSWRALWNVYYSVAAALVTLVSALQIQKAYQPWFVAMMAIGFVIFAAGNFVNLQQIREQRSSLTQYAISRTRDELLRGTASALGPRYAVGLYIYFWALTVFVVALLVAIVMVKDDGGGGLLDLLRQLSTD